MLHIIKNYKNLFLGVVESNLLDKQAIIDAAGSNSKLTHTEAQKVWDKGGEDIYNAMKKDPTSYQEYMSQVGVDVMKALNAIGTTIETASTQHQNLRKDVDTQNSNRNTGYKAYKTERTGDRAETNKFTLNLESADRILSNMTTKEMGSLMVEMNKRVGLMNKIGRGTWSSLFEGKGYAPRGFMGWTEATALGNIIRKYQAIGARAHAYTADQLIKKISDQNADGIIDSRTRLIGEAQLRNAISQTKGGFTNVLRATGFTGLTDFRRQLAAKPFFAMQKIRQSLNAYVNSGGATVATIVEGRTDRYNRILNGTEKAAITKLAYNECNTALASKISNKANREHAARYLAENVVVDGVQRTGVNPADFIKNFSRNLNISHQIGTNNYGVTYNGVGSFANFGQKVAEKLTGIIPYVYKEVGGFTSLRGNPVSIFGARVKGYPVFAGLGGGVDLTSRKFGGNVEIGYKNVDKKVANVKIREAQKVLNSIIGLRTQKDFTNSNFYKNSSHKAGDLAVFRQIKSMEKQGIPKANIVQGYTEGYKQKLYKQLGSEGYKIGKIGIGITSMGLPTYSASLTKQGVSFNERMLNGAEQIDATTKVVKLSEIGARYIDHKGNRVLFIPNKNGVRPRIVSFVPNVEVENVSGGIVLSGSVRTIRRDTTYGMRGATQTLSIGGRYNSNTPLDYGTTITQDIDCDIENKKPVKKRKVDLTKWNKLSKAKQQEIRNRQLALRKYYQNRWENMSPEQQKAELAKAKSVKKEIQRDCGGNTACVQIQTASAATQGIPVYFDNNIGITIVGEDKPKPKPVEETGTEDETGEETGVETEPTGNEDTGTENETGEETGTENETGEETGTENETGEETGTENETGEETGTENETGEETGTENETGEETGTENETGVETGTENETGVETQPTGNEYTGTENEGSGTETENEHSGTESGNEGTGRE